MARGGLYYECWGQYRGKSWAFNPGNKSMPWWNFTNFLLKICCKFLPEIPLDNCHLGL